MPPDIHIPVGSRNTEDPTEDFGFLTQQQNFLGWDILGESGCMEAYGKGQAMRE